MSTPFAEYRRFAGAVIALALSLLSAPRPAHADGCFVWKNEKIDIAEPEQKAVVAFKDGWEELTLEVKYAGPPDEFGWIVPLPARPTLSPGRARLFTSLSMRTQEPRVGRCRAAWGLRATLGGIESDPRVTVLERRQVGIYDAAILSSTGGAVLSDWLRTNAFHAPPRAEVVFDDYARRGWVFVALKIPPAAMDSTTGAKLAAGTIQPIRFRFPTQAPVFPLRISSLNRGPADILIYLLANDQFVHATCRKGKWEERMCGPMRLEYVDPDSHFAADGQPTFFVSKLRARLKPEQMEDLTFAPYDAVAGLASRDLEARIEAASYVGFSKRAEALPALIRFLAWRRRDPLEYLPMQPFHPREPAPRSSQDVRSALWALGEIGALEAVPTLVHWARGPAGETTLEAFDSLERLKAPEALPLCVERIRSTAHADDYDFAARALRDIAFESLTARGGGAMLPRLRELARAEKGRALWLKVDHRLLQGNHVGSRLLTTLAACGDDEARRFLLEALLEGSAVTATDRMLTEAQKGGSDNYYPSSLHVGNTLFSESKPYPFFWPALCAVFTGLEARPALRDELLRGAAAESVVPDLGRTLLLGLLSTPVDADRRALDALWDRALRQPAVARVPVDYAWGQYDALESYNLPACAVANAFTRWGDAGSLRRLWDACPSADSTLRAEIAVGLARCGQADDIARIVDYVRHDWAARATSADFTHRLTVELADHAILDHGLGIDAEYRMRRIHGYLRRVPGGVEAARRLTADAGLPPALRLDLLAVTRGELAERAVILKEIERKVTPRGALARAVATIQKSDAWHASYRPMLD